MIFLDKILSNSTMIPTPPTTGIDSGDVNTSTTQQQQQQLPPSTTTTAQSTQQKQSFSSPLIPSNRRLDRTTICLPIVHGSVSYYLGKRAENKNEYQSHQWTLYLRGIDETVDLSICIEKVIFQLHPSFPQPIREYKHPPYEVTEKGWGEFEAQIFIHWKDPTEQMTMVCAMYVQLRHFDRRTSSGNVAIYGFISHHVDNACR
jgi:YEATS family